MSHYPLIADSYFAAAYKNTAMNKRTSNNTSVKSVESVESSDVIKNYTIPPPPVELDKSIAAINEMRRDEGVIQKYEEELITYRASLLTHLTTPQKYIKILFDKLVVYLTKEVNKYIRNEKISETLVKSVLESPEKIKDKDTTSEQILSDLISAVNNTYNEKYSDIYKKLKNIVETKFVETERIRIYNPTLHDQSLNFIVKLFKNERITNRGRSHTKNELLKYKLGAYPPGETFKFFKPKLQYFKSLAETQTNFGINNENETKLNKNLLQVIEEVKVAIIDNFNIIGNIQQKIEQIDKTLAKIQSRMGNAVPPPSKFVNVDYKKVTTPVLEALKSDLDKYKQSLEIEKRPYTIKNTELEHYKNILHSIIDDVVSNSYISALVDTPGLLNNLTTKFYNYMLNNSNEPIEEGIDFVWKGLIDDSKDIVKKYRNTNISMAELQNILFEDVGFKIKSTSGHWGNIAEEVNQYPSTFEELVIRLKQLERLPPLFLENQIEVANRILKGLSDSDIIQTEYVNKNVYNKTMRKIKNINKELNERRSGSRRVQNPTENSRNVLGVRYGTRRQTNQSTQPTQPTRSFFKRIGNIFTKKAPSPPKKQVVWRNNPTVPTRNTPVSVPTARIANFKEYTPTKPVTPHPNVIHTTAPQKSILKPVSRVETKKRSILNPFSWFRKGGGRNKTRKLRK